MDIINDKTPMTGTGTTWNTEIVTFHEVVQLDLWGAVATDTVFVERVLYNPATPPCTSNQDCCIKAGVGETFRATKPLMMCVAGVESPAQITLSKSTLTIPAGSYVFQFSGAGFVAHSTILTADKTSRKPCDCECK
jgi:hypothetical protein